jgi:hypothetical protein
MTTLKKKGPAKKRGHPLLLITPRNQHDILYPKVMGFLPGRSPAIIAITIIHQIKMQR